MNSRTIPATEPPNTRKSRIRKRILGRFFFSAPAFAGPAPPGAPIGGEPAGPGMGGPPGAAPIEGTGIGAPPPGGGSPGPPLGASNEGLGPPIGGSAEGAPPGGNVGDGESAGAASEGAGPGAGAPGAGATVGKLGVREGAGARVGGNPVATGVGEVGAEAGATGAGTGIGAGATGFGPGEGTAAAGAAAGIAEGDAGAEVGIGAGVPSVGLILGANGDRVTRNFGPPSPGFTGAPSFGVSLRVGLGGLGVPSVMIEMIQIALAGKRKRKIYSFGVFFLIRSEISSMDASSIAFPLMDRSSKVLNKVSVILSWVFSDPPKIENLSACVILL